MILHLSLRAKNISVWVSIHVRRTIVVQRITSSYIMRLSKDVALLENLMGRDMDFWKEKELIAGVFLIIAAWGRGDDPTEVIPVS